jgi:hypothetical protein
MTISVTLTHAGAKLYQGAIQIDDTPVEVWSGPLPSGRKYVAFWEKPEPTISVIFASGELSLGEDGVWSGDIVSVRRGKPRGWRATAAKGSATIEFVECR